MKKPYFPIMFVTLVVTLSVIGYRMVRSRSNEDIEPVTELEATGPLTTEYLNHQPEPDKTSNSLTQAPKAQTTPVVIKGKSELELAQNTLVTFFDLLSQKEYGKAATLFADDKLSAITVYSPEEFWSDEAVVLGQYCAACQTCNRVEVTSSEFVRDGLYQFKVRFFLADGSLYIFGPCCGASEEEMPPKSEFDYTVEKIDGIYQVTTPPLYRP